MKVMDPVTLFRRMSTDFGYDVGCLKQIDTVAHHSNDYGIPLRSKHSTNPVLAQGLTRGLKDDIIVELHARFIMRYFGRNS